MSFIISDIPNIEDPNAESIYGTPTTTTISIDGRKGPNHQQTLAAIPSKTIVDLECQALR